VCSILSQNPLNRVAVDSARIWCLYRGSIQCGVSYGHSAFLKAGNRSGGLLLRRVVDWWSRLLVRNRARTKRLWTVGLILIYLAVMSAVFAATTFVVACKFGDCL